MRAPSLPLANVLRRVLVVAVAAALAPSAARAQDRTRVAVLPFSGPAKEALKGQADCVKTLRKSYDIVTQTDWDKSANKLFATERNATDIAAVAKDLNVAVVITGAVKQKPDWKLIITVRFGANGEASEKLEYPLRGPKVDPGTLRKITDDLMPLVDKAAQGPTGTTSTDKATDKIGEDTEAPLAPKEEKKEPTVERPVWAPFVDAEVGYILSGRSFTFDASDKPHFGGAPGGNGVRVDVTAYPLAFLSTREGPAMNAIQGLGIGLTYDLPVWGDSNKVDAAGMAAHFPTSESRLEVGLRWHWNVYAKDSKPDLIVHLEYGSHSFSINKATTGCTGGLMTCDAGPPDVAYSYFTIGVGGRFPIIAQVAGFADVHLHIVTDSGPIQTQAEYGPGGNLGFRLNAGFEAHPYKGLVLRLAGYYERFGLSFDEPTATPPTQTLPSGSTGATDQYYGFALTAGWQY